MGGDESQKLLPWRRIRIPSGAQQNSGSLENQHSSSKAICSGTVVPARHAAGLGSVVGLFSDDPASWIARGSG
jgi:hypothetical protein